MSLEKIIWTLKSSLDECHTMCDTPSECVKCQLHYRAPLRIWRNIHNLWLIKYKSSHWHQHQSMSETSISGWLINFTNLFDILKAFSKMINFLDEYNPISILTMTSSMQVMTGGDEWWCLVRMVLGARPKLKFAFSGAKCKTSSNRVIVTK